MQAKNSKLAAFKDNFRLRRMLDAIELTNDAAWTQLRNLHHQTKSISPRLTEDVQAEHLRLSDHPEPSASPPGHALTRRWTGIQRARWKFLIAAAVICRFDIHTATDEFGLTCLTSIKYMYSSRHPCLSTIKAGIERAGASSRTTARASTGTSARNCNLQQLRGSRIHGLLQSE